MVVSENEVYQIIKKSCISENIYDDRAEDIGKAISFLHTNYINGCAEFKKLITDPNAKKNISLKKEKNSLITTNLSPIENGIPIIDWLLSGQNKEARIINQIMSPLIFFALLAKNFLNYGGKFQISDEKQSIIFIIDENFKFPKINLLTGYFIITWSKMNLTFQPNKTKYKMHNVDLATWKYLQKKAFKTYVPESIQSRKLGAGAGLLDND